MSRYGLLPIVEADKEPRLVLIDREALAAAALLEAAEGRLRIGWITADGQPATVRLV
jgi:hypothetical protein